MCVPRSKNNINKHLANGMKCLFISEKTEYGFFYGRYIFAIFIYNGQNSQCVFFITQKSYVLPAKIIIIKKGMKYTKKNT